MHTTEGNRLLIEREYDASDVQSASYVAAIYTVNDCFRYQATLCTDGTATLTAVDAPAAADDADALMKLAKSTARAAKRKLTDQLAPWPPRVLRWRGPGRG